MELDDVREAWTSLEASLRRTERLSDVIVVDSLSSRAQTPLQRERVFLWLEIAINVLAVVALGSFAVDRAGSLAGICAAFLGAALLAINGTLIRIAVGISRLDFEKPIVALQSDLARTQVLRAALVAATLIAGPLLWAPLLVILVAAAGVDPVRALGVPFIVANAAFGAFVVVVALLTARAFGPHLRKSTWTARVVDALSGKSYGEAADYLDTIERYRDTSA